MSLKYDYSKTIEKCEIVMNENNQLKRELSKPNDSIKIEEVDFKQKESELIEDIEDMKNTIAIKENLLVSTYDDKETLQKDFGNLMKNFELIKEELADKEEYIQKILSESSSKKSLPVDMDESILENKNLKDELHNANLQEFKCISCMERERVASSSSSGFGSNGVFDSPLLDVSFDEPPLEFNVVNNCPEKSLGDEFVEVKTDLDAKRRDSLRKISYRMQLLEEDLIRYRKALDNSFKTMLKIFKRPTYKKLTRYRVTDGNMHAMEFTKYEGVKIPCSE